MYYEVKSSKTMHASIEDAWSAISQETNSNFSGLVAKSFNDQGDYFNQSTPSWCVHKKIIAWDRTHSNTLTMRDLSKNCNVKIDHARYEIVYKDSEIRVDLVVGYRTLAKTPFKLQELVNYLNVKNAMSTNLHALKQELENGDVTAGLNTCRA